MSPGIHRPRHSLAARVSADAFSLKTARPMTKARKFILSSASRSNMHTILAASGFITTSGIMRRSSALMVPLPLRSRRRKRLYRVRTSLGSSAIEREERGERSRSCA